MAASQQDAQRPLRLLSLDGGGIRGLSPILILKEIMRQVNQGLPADRQLQPWQIFDLIGGTSTGGIIAVMLGKLRMTLKECEEQYLELGKEIFEPKRSKWDGRRLVDFLKANEKFDAAVLEQSIKRIIQEKTGDEYLPLKDAAVDGDDEGRCKVFVCSVLEHNSEPVFLRSYEGPGLADPYSDGFQLWQACRATSAASTFFNAYQHGYLNFVDGAFAYNNPVQRVMIEASRLWPGRSALLISIGTGESSGITLGGNLPTLAKRMAKLVTQTERAAEDFLLGHPEMTNNGLYFRFNVPGLNNIGLEEYKEIEAIGANTLAYLTRPDTGSKLSACVQKLRYVQPRDSGPLKIADLPRQDQDSLHALYNTAGDYQSHRALLDSPVDGTCSWILEHPKFYRWLSDSSASLLWVTGNPGTGKSVLASYIVEHLTTRLPEAVVASFFFKDAQANRTESNHAISGLLHQLFLRRLALTSCARAEFEAKGSSFTRSPEALWNISHMASVRARDTQIIFIIDALDECSEVSRNRFIRLLLSTFMSTAPGSSTGWLKVLVTSRPWPEIEAQFRDNSTIRLRSEDELRSVSHDVRLVVQHRVNELKTSGTILPDACELVERALYDGADGTFLWTSLVLESVMQLKSRALPAVQKQITRIPKTLNELYEHALPEPADDDEDTESSRQLLRILLAATRPLSLDELHLCLGMNSSTRRLKDIEHEPNMSHTVKSLGGFFVRVARSQVSLVHQTAREFLLRGDSAVSSSRIWKHSLGLHESNYALAQSCLNFLLLEDWVTYRENHLPGVEDGDDLRARLLGGLPASQRDFYMYAVESWSIHVKAGLDKPDVEVPKELQDSITALCDQKQGCYRIWWSFYAFVGSKFDNRPCLKLAAGKGDLVVLRELQSVNRLPVDPDIVTAAADGGHEEVARWILSTYDTSHLQLKDALITAIKRNSLPITNLILRARKLDLNVQYRNLYPLVAAVEYSDLAMLNFLLAKGADVYNGDALYAATTPNREGMLHFLVAKIVKTSQVENLAKTEQLFQTVLARLLIEQDRKSARDYLISKGLNLLGKHELSFKLIDGAARGRASDVDRLARSGAKDAHGVALGRSVRHSDCVRLLLSRYSYTRDQILTAIRCLGTNLAAFYYRLMTGGHRSKGKPPPLQIREAPSSQEEEDSLKQLVLELNPSWSSVSQISHGAIRLLVQPAAEAIRLSSACQDLLTLTCFLGRLENVEPILEAGILDINAKDSCGMTPLMAAVLSKSEHLVDKLLLCGAWPGHECWYHSPSVEGILPADPETTNSTASDVVDSKTPITMNMIVRDWDIIWGFLGKGSFLESPLSLGITTQMNSFFGLRFRADSEDQELFEELTKTQTAPTLSRTCDFLRLKEISGEGYRKISGWDYRTIYEIMTEAVKQKLSRPIPLFSHDESVTDGYAFFKEVPEHLITSGLADRQALHAAIKRKWYLLAEKLMDIKMLLASRDKTGKTPLHAVASQRGHIWEPLARRMLDRGADPSATDHDGQTPLHDAASSSAVEIARTLMRYGASLDATTHVASTPIHCAASSGAIETARLFIQHGVSLESTTGVGKTPLHLAAESNRGAMVKMLLDCGASMDARDMTGQTALHLAARSFAPLSESTVKALLDGGAALDATDKDGLTPIHTAIRFTKNLQLVQMLVRAWIDKGMDLETRNNEGLTMVEFAENRLSEGFSTDEIVEFLRKAFSWGYSGLDGDKIREYHERQVVESTRADPMPVEQDCWDDSDGSEIDWDEDSGSEFEAEAED